MAAKKDEFVVWECAEKGKVSRDGRTIAPPAGWVFLESGDAGLTRRVKAASEYWLVVRRRRNRIESVGLWAPSDIVARARGRLEAERASPEYQRRLASDRKRRENKQEEYEGEFHDAVVAFLKFPAKWSEMARKLAKAVTSHAVPVGSGTVARTQRIPLERRAEAAVIAWMRHQTTAYDNMSIARVKGERREVRRKLAERSRQLLQKYRAGDDVDPELCPLAKALRSVSARPAHIPPNYDLLSIDF